MRYEWTKCHVSDWTNTVREMVSRGYELVAPVVFCSHGVLLKAQWRQVPGRTELQVLRDMQLAQKAVFMLEEA